MKLSADTRTTLTFLTGLAILLTQTVVGSLGGPVSELLVGAALMLTVPEAVKLIRMGGENGNGKT